MTSVINSEGRLTGIYTDGDLRRTLDHGVDVHNCLISDVMTKGCTTASVDLLAAEGLRMMEEHKINSLLIVDDQNQVVGALNMHDLLRAGVV